ncbi:MAG: hypothetical protein IGR76_16895 [Synechococcales cyanobacterium T60_A2020_003]|nr:hypothetical protein [Synechococcales cyanobacterium T60_A2020_003]
MTPLNRPMGLGTIGRSPNPHPTLQKLNLALVSHLPTLKQIRQGVPLF